MRRRHRDVGETPTALAPAARHTPGRALPTFSFMSTRIAAVTRPIADQAPARVWEPPGPFRGNFLPVATVLFLAGGFGAWLWVPARLLADDIWTVGLLITGAPVVWRTLQSALRRQFSTDITATLAIIAAILVGQ